MAQSVKNDFCMNTAAYAEAFYRQRFAPTAARTDEIMRPQITTDGYLYIGNNPELGHYGYVIGNAAQLYQAHSKSLPILEVPKLSWVQRGLATIKGWGRSIVKYINTFSGFRGIR